MPYKDPEMRRRCSRESKRRARARQAHPFHRFRIYLCVRFPNLNIGLVSFDGGFLIVDVVARPDIKAQVERHPEFGVRIFPLSIDINEL